MPLCLCASMANSTAPPPATPRALRDRHFWRGARRPPATAPARSVSPAPTTWTYQLNPLVTHQKRSQAGSFPFFLTIFPLRGRWRRHSCLRRMAIAASRTSPGIAKDQRSTRLLRDSPAYTPAFLVAPLDPERFDQTIRPARASLLLPASRLSDAR